MSQNRLVVPVSELSRQEIREARIALNLPPERDRFQEQSMTTAITAQAIEQWRAGLSEIKPE